MTDNGAVEKYVIYGAGRLGVTFPIEELADHFKLCAYCDSSTDKQGTEIKGYPVISKSELKVFCDNNEIDFIVVAIGNPAVKKTIEDELIVILGSDIELRNYNDLFYFGLKEWKQLKSALLQKVEQVSIDAAFFEAGFAYFIEAGSPLVNTYKNKGKEILVVFPDIDDGEWSFSRRENIVRLCKIVDGYEKDGIRCVSLSTPGFDCCSIRCCFNLGYDMRYIPYDMDFGKDRRNIGVQSTPFLTHTYIKYPGQELESFDSIFGEDIRDKVDCYIGSDYFCDWIVGKGSLWKDKVARLGYPRMDKLYQAMNKPAEVPREWIGKIAGRVVVFSALYNIDPYLKLFPKECSDRILIWRPHPLNLSYKDYVDRIKKYEDEYSVIVDFQPNYYAASSVSDALISDLEVSLNLNYLYYQKPILLIMKENQVGDYEEQAWYKAMYKAKDIDEVKAFIDMIARGDDDKKEELQAYKEYMTGKFDGKVCERIFDFVENM